MKFWDILKLIRHEYRYEKQEWILSVVLQCLIFCSVFFLITFACNMDEICGEYISPLYPDGFEFRLNGYSVKDVSELEKMGFHSIIFSEGTNQGYGVKDSLRGIWFHKLHAVFVGKDIWNAELDEILSVIFFCQITFGAIAIALFLIMLNNLSNSVAVKLMRRKGYIQMLRQLGCSQSACQRIYYSFFAMRIVFALLPAVWINGYLIHLLNKYLTQSMYIQTSLPQYRWMPVVGIGALSVLLMCVSFQKQWRQLDEC